MNYRLTYDPQVTESLVSAISYYLSYHPDRAAAAFLALVDDAFVMPCKFPEAMPLDRVRAADGSVARRVTVWHFIFIYRIDSLAGELVVEKVFHERSGSA